MLRIRYSQLLITILVTIKSTKSTETITQVLPNNITDTRRIGSIQFIEEQDTPSIEDETRISHDSVIPFNLSKSPIKLFNKPETKKRKIEKNVSDDQKPGDWRCPNITNTRSLECGCDLPHTLRCSGDIHGLETLARSLRASPYTVSLLDCTLKNVTILSDARIFENISLHGLVISSGEIKRVYKLAFAGLSSPLQALGLPSNALLSVPWSSISPLTSLERLDLSNNKIKALGASDFTTLHNLNYLELTDNEISSIAIRTFTTLKKLEVLKLGGNRLGDYPASLQAIGQCYNLRHLDLRSNSISGPLTGDILPRLINLEFLNLERNLIKNIQNKALKGFTRLKSLSLRHNQIDVLQDHAFFGLGTLESLDLSYNGIVAVSSSSLQHLSRLSTLDLTHNFLRALTSDLIVPLPSLKELRLGGNDISIVAKNALDGANELTSLSLEENPLSCDCSVKLFSEWLQASKISVHDLMSATCATPPHLEGAPLFQVPMESLTCDTDDIETDNANIIEQLEAFSRQNNSTHVRDLSEKISLRDFHFSTDYGLILTWAVNLGKTDYTCDAIFVYKEENIHELLIDNSPIHCESKIINGQNTVSVIVPDSSVLSLGENYRFCLVLVQEKNIKAELVVGCSNITKLQTDDQSSEVRLFSRNPKLPTDISSMERISTGSDEFTRSRPDDFNTSDRNTKIRGYSTLDSGSYGLYDNINKSFLPGLGLGILITSIVVLLWGASRIRNNTRTSPTVTTCYAASDRIAHIADPESGNRYLKLQATTSL